MNAAMPTLRTILVLLLPGLADGLVPAVLAAVNPSARPGRLLSAEQWCDGPGDELRVAATRQQWLALRQVPRN